MLQFVSILRQKVRIVIYFNDQFNASLLNENIISPQKNPTEPKVS